MKVLWFEVSEPGRFVDEKRPVMGWQDALENIVRTCEDIELGIAFMTQGTCKRKVLGNVSYFPIFYKYSFCEKQFRNYWDIYVKKMLPHARKIINEFKPDIIHIFGTEWPYGQISSYVNVPVVIHIQGSIIPYNNAVLPPNYSIFDLLLSCGINIRKIFSLWKNIRDKRNREEWERKTWLCVSNYMGRTMWDESLSAILHSQRNYFHVEEALRPIFLKNDLIWKGIENRRIKLISTGCSSFWKGPDMMLKVAKILKDLQIDFVWNIAGSMPDIIKSVVEKKQKLRFEDYNINILGFVEPEKLCDLLCSSTMYIHTAYIENSPNSICEAQCMGVPVISTNVGGISSLVREGIDGILVPANDPWQMAFAIKELAQDKERMKYYSVNGKKSAIMRHDNKLILKQLFDCYNTILNK